MKTIEKEAEEFQETIVRSIDQHIIPYFVRLKGYNYVMFPETFNPNYGKASLLLLDNLGVKKGDVVLDPFTGCGTDAIFAVLNGASKAVAIDKSTMPYLCARYNAYQLGLEDKVDVRQGDLFDILKPNEKFDLIIANPPFQDTNPDTNTETAFKDKKYKTLTRFWNKVENHLKPNGRIRCVFSPPGDIDFFNKLVEENNFKSKVVAETKYASDVLIKVYEMTSL